MANRNLQPKKLTRADVETAVRAVEGFPNTMDMNFDSVDPDPTSLNLGVESDGSVVGESSSNYQRSVGECILCGQPLTEESDLASGMLP